MINSLVKGLQIMFPTVFISNIYPRFCIPVIFFTISSYFSIFFI